MKAIGLMSGTSLDGVDVALIETDGDRIAALGPSFCRPYEEGERAVLRRALGDAVTLTDRTARPGILSEAEELVTRTHGDAVETFLAKTGIADVDVIGFHGQTVLHRPAQQLTVQIGDGAALARRLGRHVVHDFRAADVAAGGQGAPLVPIFHRALAETLARDKPIAVLNIGGVANVTFIDDHNDPVACDTGPGNALIDDFMRARTGLPYDEAGETGGRGKVDEAFVARVLADPFFDRPPPKSLDRNDFSLAALALPEFSTADGAATLAALTARAVARVVPHLPRPPKSWIVAGGGARNRTIFVMLERWLAPATVATADAIGWSADALEAQAFAYMAVRTLKGLPITFPTTTGVARPLAGGIVARVS